MKGDLLDSAEVDDPEDRTKQEEGEEKVETGVEPPRFLPNHPGKILTSSCRANNG